MSIVFLRGHITNHVAHNHFPLSTKAVEEDSVTTDMCKSCKVSIGIESATSCLEISSVTAELAVVFRKGAYNG